MDPKIEVPVRIEDFFASMADDMKKFQARYEKLRNYIPEQVDTLYTISDWQDFFLQIMGDTDEEFEKNFAPNQEPTPDEKAQSN